MTARPPVPPDLLARLKQLLGPAGYLDAPEDKAPYLAERRGRFPGASPAVLRPDSAQAVAAAVRLCAAAGIALVPQGGNTGLAGGSTPDADGTALLLSLSRLNRIRHVDPVDHTITVEAGCVLQRVQEAAEAVDRLFPLSLGSEGSSQIGGLISTNAGGTMTLRYGNMREQVLGLEVVLPDGQVWDGLRRLRKNNTGYDLKQLFIGAEGTLGIVTAAVLQLSSRPRRTETAFAAVASPAAALDLLTRLRTATGDAVSAFELIPRIALDFALRHVDGTRDPLAGRHDWYVLTELASGAPGGGLREALEDTLAAAIGDGVAVDATIAESEAAARALWFIREAIVQAQRFEGGSIKHDISVPVSRIPEFLGRAIALVQALVPGARPMPFGHVGDGNIHFNVTQPEGADTAAFLARWDEVTHAVHELVLSLDGSISAEHGIGRVKRGEMAWIKAPVELDLMRRIKAALDPEDIMNPNRLLP